jgi:nondiscriminating aspartyl-tRNA synthetase
MTEFYPQRMLSSELPHHISQKVIISGWLHKKRSLGQLTFILVRDRHGLVQVIIEEAEEAQKLDGLYQGTILTIEGIVQEEPRALGGVEIHQPSLQVEVPVTTPSPIEIDKPINHNPENLDTLLDWRIINMRNPIEQGIWKIQASVGDTIRAYLTANDFTEFHSPKLLAGSTEGGAEVFKLDYFGKQATLAQSAQFYKQIMVGSLERVFEFGSTYRAEPSVTTRHMTEFITVDVEMGFINDYTDIMKLLNNLLIDVCQNVWETRCRELIALKAEKPALATEFPRVTLQQLHDLCFKETGQDFRGEKDPSPFEERWICAYSAQHWGSEAVFITEFPASDMKFYHYRLETNPLVTERFDLLFRGVEIATGSRREHRYPQLLAQLEAIGANPESEGYKYYLQAFKYGMPNHGGFGLGLERLTQKIINLNNVKEATLFPRDTKRLSP